MLSKSGNPSLDSLAAVLNACGLRLAVQSTVSAARGSAESPEATIAVTNGGSGAKTAKWIKPMSPKGSFSGQGFSDLKN